MGYLHWTRGGDHGHTLRISSAEIQTAVRQIMALLPFLELEAQACNQQQLEEWGERGAFAQQLQMLDRIQKDEENDDRARAMCAKWATICRTADYTEVIVLASDNQRWYHYVDDSLMRSRPFEIPLNYWFTLHVLPYTIREWRDTVMGRAPESALAVWYHELEQVPQLCLAIAENYDWSLAVHLQLVVARVLAPYSTVKSGGEGQAAPHQLNRPTGRNRSLVVPRKPLWRRFTLRSKPMRGNMR
ncbi:unnamed protein product [Peronospora farinosa]|uniref:Uncharacterized protein n=1 Tax=Peronospora farinosa TaxID=134698 RepID=A0ABN8C0E5_9STRA|nr:unnamed protein product [Peronospora farinosa]